MNSLTGEVMDLQEHFKLSTSNLLETFPLYKRLNFSKNHKYKKEIHIPLKHLDHHNCGDGIWACLIRNTNKLIVEGFGRTTTLPDFEHYNNKTDRIHFMS